MKGMKAFEYVNARDVQHAAQLLGRDAEQKEVRLLAGGVDLITEMQARIIEPDRVINLKSIPGLDRIQVNERGLTLGPLATLAAIERHPDIRRDFTALADAAHSVGSPQIRNVGTIGGNLCQRPRCWYYRDETIKCFKKGGVRCYAAEDDGANKYNAILGGGPSFIVHPSDCAPALVALGAIIRYGSGRGRPKEIAAEDFFVLPSQRLHFENVLGQSGNGDDLILQEIFVPRPRAGTRSTYLKFRERDSFDWALSSVAAVCSASGGSIESIRIVLGGVAPKPWRTQAAEKLLTGKAYSRELANQAADAALEGAKPLSKNSYKVPLTRVLVRRAIELVATGRSSVNPPV